MTGWVLVARDAVMGSPSPQALLPPHLFALYTATPVDRRAA